MTTIPASDGKAEQTTLPRADLFDVLPALHEILSRIDHHPVADATQDVNSNTDASTSAYTDLTPLEPRDLPTEVLTIKSKIRRTMRELEKLPDMNRSVEQQEQEIKSLEKRIQQQKALIEKLRSSAISINNP